MGRLLWPLALGVAFVVGWTVGGTGRSGPPPAADAARERETVSRLRQKVETLEARLRASEEAAAARGSRTSDDRFGVASAMDPTASPGVRPGGAAPSETTRPVERASAPAGSGGAGTVVLTVAGALDRFYRYLDATKGSDGRTRWREARELVEDLRAMGPAAGQALMQVLSAGTDSDERRAAARLLGTLRIAEALPVLRDVLEHDTDLLLRRSAAYGLRRLQTPESLPIMEHLLTRPGEDRFVRLSAAAGLAHSGRPQGVTGLAQIFEESTADGRGRDLAFRALANLKDERALPFMRQLVTSQAEPSYRLQAIRYLQAQADQQALGTLHVLMQSPQEQPSIRDAAAQAYTALGGK